MICLGVDLFEFVLFGDICPSCIRQSYWFSNQVKRTHPPMLDPRAEVTICGLYCLLPRWGSPRPCNLPPLLCPLLGVLVLIWLFLFSSYPILYGSFLRPWFYKSHSVSLQLVFSENCSTCRDVFLMYSWRVRGGVNSSSSYFTILISFCNLFLNDTGRKK